MDPIAPSVVLFKRGEQACRRVSKSNFRSFVAFVILTCGLETGCLHESQLANHSTVRLRSCRSLHENVACLAACGISVQQVALMPCSLAQRLQKKEPASSSVGLGSRSISNEAKNAMCRLPASDVCVLGLRHCNSRMHEAAVKRRRSDLHVPQRGIVGFSCRLRVQQTFNFTSYCTYATVRTACAPVGGVQVIAWQVPWGTT